MPAFKLLKLNTRQSVKKMDCWIVTDWGFVGALSLERIDLSFLVPEFELQFFGDVKSDQAYNIIPNLEFIEFLLCYLADNAVAYFRSTYREHVRMWGIRDVSLPFESLVHDTNNVNNDFVIRIYSVKLWYFLRHLTRRENLSLIANWIRMQFAPDAQFVFPLVLLRRRNGKICRWGRCGDRRRGPRWSLSSHSPEAACQWTGEGAASVPGGEGLTDWSAHLVRSLSGAHRPRRALPWLEGTRGECLLQHLVFVSLVFWIGEGRPSFKPPGLVTSGAPCCCVLCNMLRDSFVCGAIYNIVTHTVHTVDSSPSLGTVNVGYVALNINAKCYLIIRWNTPILMKSNSQRCSLCSHFRRPWTLRWLKMCSAF